MIRTMILRPGEPPRCGAQELADQWLAQRQGFLWLDLQGENKDAERQWMERFNLHPLAIQDAQRERHPPKFEMFPDHSFVLLRGLAAEVDSLDVETIQLALFSGEDFLISRHDRHSVSVDHWWRQTSGGAETDPRLLGQRIAAFAASRYLTILHSFEPRLAEIEEEMFNAPNDRLLAELIGYRTRLRSLSRVFNYHVRLFSGLRAALEDTADEEQRHLLNDVYEKYERLHSLGTMFYDLTGDLIDGYISTASHQLNNTVRILTVITAIFVPLTFLAGIYGMNFQHMPELGHPAGYFVLLALMVGLAVGLLILFRRLRWL